MAHSRTPIPPQLRSKTPTTDRLLFPTPSSTAANSDHNHTDYMYLNGAQPTNKVSQLSELYSTVNKTTRALADLKTDAENVAPRQNHAPIYDATTNLQHQRLVNNMTKIRDSQFVANRSKTPGPDVIYFRNEPGTTKSFFPGAHFSKAATISTATGNGLLNRSKTPTADMMYYPMPNSTSTLNPKRPIAETTASTMYGVYEPDEGWTGGEGERLVSDVDGNSYLEILIELMRQESGFGFRIVGGEEEGSQVAVGYIVQSGAAHIDGRLRPNDEIVMIDGECVLGSTHRRVVQLMTIAGLKGVVKLLVRRKVSPSSRPSPFLQRQTRLPSSLVTYPHSLTLYRNGNEGFGFVIISTMHKTGPSIGELSLSFLSCT